MSGAATLEPIYRARPTIRFSGVEDERATQLVQSMEMTEAEGGMRSLELTLSDWASTRDGGAGPAFTGETPVRLGAEIELYGGEVDQPRELFRGKITALEARHHRGEAPELTVLAEDALMAARMARRSRVLREMSPADVVRAVAGDLGLRPVVDGLAEPRRRWVQLDETDLAFLRRVLSRCDADLQVVGTELHVAPRSEVRRSTVTLSVHEDLRALTVCADLAEQVTAVTVRGWDAVRGRAVAASRTAGTDVGPGSGRAGWRTLADTLGERPENLGHLVADTEAEATALAEAAFDRRARRFVRATGTAEGNPNLRVGVHLTLTDTGGRFDNEYYVVSTRHLFDPEEGYRTEFAAECAFLPEGS